MNRARVGRLVREKRMTTPFQRFPGTYRHVRIAFVEGARKRPDEFKRRLRHLVGRSAKNERFGMIQR